MGPEARVIRRDEAAGDPLWKLPEILTLEEHREWRFGGGGILRGRKIIAWPVLLQRYVCRECGGPLECYEYTFGSMWWSVRCQADPGHSGPMVSNPRIMRGLVYEALEREGRAQCRSSN